MIADRDPAHETKKAMFWCALVAQHADEPVLSVRRIASSLLRTNQVAEFCGNAQVDVARLRAAVDDALLPFEECRQRVRADLEARGIVFASQEHQASVRLRPLDPVAKSVFDRVLEHHGHLAIPPLELLRELMGIDPALAEELAGV